MTGNEHFYLDWQFLIYSTLVLGWLFWRKNYQFRLKRETKLSEYTSGSNRWFVPLQRRQLVWQALCSILRQMWRQWSRRSMQWWRSSRWKIQPYLYKGETNLLQGHSYHQLWRLWLGLDPTTWR